VVIGEGYCGVEGDDSSECSLVDGQHYYEVLRIVMTASPGTWRRATSSPPRRYAATKDGEG
jgi:hypothetical protein